MAGKLSTHVLDTSLGRPAAGIIITLWLQHGAEWRQVASTVTNSDGRTDQPLLAGDEVRAGVYELRFQVGAYFKSQGATALAKAGPAFLDEVLVRFGLADATANYHVPLLVTPWSYGTYRGS